MPLPIYFDAYAVINPRVNKHHAAQWSLSHLNMQMQQASISGALVQSTQSVLTDPMRGNVNLSQQLTDQPNLLPVWNFLPGGWDESPPAETLPALLRSHNVRAVTLSPQDNNWSLRSVTSRPLLTALAQSGLPLLLCSDQLKDHAELEWFLECFPDWPIVLTSAVWRDQRKVLPMLEAFGNLHLTFDRFQVNLGLEQLVERGYEDRLLFGTNAPTMSMGAHRTYIDYAQISDVARQKIAGGNLARLLGVELPSPPPDHCGDPLIEAAMHGRPMPTPVIDFHVHVLDEGGNSGGGDSRLYAGGPTALREHFDRLGVCGANLLSWTGPASCDAVGGNRCLTDALNKFPDTYWGAPTIDPAHQSLDQMSAQIQRVYADPRMLGMKPYPRYGLWYDHPRYEPWWAFGEQHRLYALLHINDYNFEQVDYVAKRYPNVRWVIAHCGSSFGFADSAIALANKYSNVYLEITYTSVYAGIIEYLVAGAGADRVLYGSDAAMRDPRQQLGWVVYADPETAIKKNILFHNALAVIEPCARRLAPIQALVEQYRGHDCLPLSEDRVSLAHRSADTSRA